MNFTTPTDAVKCLLKGLFTLDELTSSSVTGKKTVKSKDTKDGLDERRRLCAEGTYKN